MFLRPNFRVLHRLTSSSSYSPFVVSYRVLFFSSSLFTLNVSSDYISGYTSDVKVEITGVLYHEMVHVLQWNGNGQTNDGLIEGIADFVRLNAGYAPSHWVRPGQDDRWDHGYDVTANFVADLNEKMMSEYSDGFFVDLLGKSVDQR